MQKIIQFNQFNSFARSAHLKSVIFFSSELYNLTRTLLLVYNFDFVAKEPKKIVGRNDILLLFIGSDSSLSYNGEHVISDC